MARAMKDSGIPWIGKIPEGWKTIRFKYLHNGLNTGEAIDKEFWSKDDNGRTFYTAGLVPIKTNYTDFPDWKYTKNTDLLLARNGTPYVYLPSENACYTDHIIRASMKEQINRKFVQYSLQQSILSVVVDSVSIATWSASLWDEQTIAWPSPEEQKGIVDYLDAECARIDVVMEQTRASIEEYKKLKQSVITQAVTKGIRPNRPMKDSGIDWIGEIPESWDMVKLKYFLSSDKVNLRVGPFGSALSGADIKQEGVWVYNQRVVIDNNFTETNTFISEEKYEELKGFEVLPDDVLITTRGSIGKVAIVPPNAERGVLHPCVIKFRVDQNLISHTLIWYIFNCTDIAMRQIKDMSNSTTIEVLYSYSLRNVQIPLIPEEERKEIEEYIVSVANEYDRMIECKKRLLIELEEYKRALIFEYVTGKKEVQVNGYHRRIK